MNGRQMADAARVARPVSKCFSSRALLKMLLSATATAPGMHILTKPFALETLANRIKVVDRETAECPRAWPPFSWYFLPEVGWHSGRPISVLAPIAWNLRMSASDRRGGSDRAPRLSSYRG